MIRVLHLITTLQSGGAQTMLANLVTGGNSGSSVRHVVVEMMANGDVGQRIGRAGVAVHSLGMDRGRASARAAWDFVRLLRRERPSLVQTWLYHADLLGLVAIPSIRVPVVWNIRCAWHLGIRGFAARSCARLSRLPAAVVVNSHAGQDIHRQIGYRPRHWRLIPNGFDLDVFKPDESARTALRAELRLAPETTLVGMLGRWDPHKDHATFLAAAARLGRKFADVHFVLAGDGIALDNSELGNRIQELQLSDRVHLLGRRSDVAAVTAALDVASCTSLGEAFPNVVGEAMSAGVPCVATDVGDAAALLAECGRIVPPRNPDAIAAAWAEILSMDQDARRALGMAGRSRIARLYALPAVVEQYERLYQDVLKVKD